VSIDFDCIRARNPLREYCGRNGMSLRRSGSNYVGRCPLHGEVKGDAFVVFDDRHWRCFGKCQRGGDVLDLDQALYGGTKQEAAQRLGGEIYNATTPVKRLLKKKLISCPYQLASADIELANAASLRLAHDNSLLARFVERRPEWSIEALCGCALDGDLGFANSELLFCYSNGIKARGKRADGNRYFRWIIGNSGGQCWRQSLLLPSHKTVFVTEGESDALTMIAQGYDVPGNALVVALPSASNLPHSEAFLGKEIVIIPDTDEAGISCAEKLKERLKRLCRKVSVVDLS
jgi:CHC2 zinc finger/Toprim-like